MQFILALLFSVFAALFANAAPAPPLDGALFHRGDSGSTSPGNAGQCNAGPTHCCNTYTATSNYDASTASVVSSLLGVVVGDLGNGLGIGCSSLVGGASW